MKIKTAKEILREMEITTVFKDITVDIDEDLIVNAMIVYAQQFIDLAAKEALAFAGEIREEDILNLKKQIQ